ncbi:hypothetical protein CHELA1G11_11113 [Hyphomicrobiales bacterium]|nr:hypothetical protein CHELA1G11_11113 [Hyphomicrobiales bacterium]
MLTNRRLDAGRLPHFRHVSLGALLPACNRRKPNFTLQGGKSRAKRIKRSMEGNRSSL